MSVEYAYFPSVVALRGQREAVGAQALADAVEVGGGVMSVDRDGDHLDRHRSVPYAVPLNGINYDAGKIGTHCRALKFD
jgi:hypothetical protein